MAEEATAHSPCRRAFPIRRARSDSWAGCATCGRESASVSDRSAVGVEVEEWGAAWVEEWGAAAADGSEE